jgi:hypothetical protein
VRRQRLQRWALKIKTLADASIAAPDNLVDEASIGLERVEIARPAQQQRVLDRPLHMAVRAFDGAVLVRQAPIVTGRLHAVMSGQRLVAPRLILPRVIAEIAEGSRQTVAAVLQRGLAERPQRILQTLRQCHEALTAEHDMSMLPAREGQAEVIEPVIERHAGNADAVIAMSVKSDKPNRPGEGSCRKTTSRSAPLSARQVRMRRSKVRRIPAPSSGWRRRISSKIATGRRPALFSKGTTSLSNRCQRIAPSAAARRFLLRRQSPILFDAIGARGAEPGFGRGNGWRLGLAETHIQPALPRLKCSRKLRCCLI